MNCCLTLLPCQTVHLHRGAVQVTGHLSLWTVRSVLRTVQHFCRWLADRGYVCGNPARTLKLPKEPKKDPKGVSDETFQRLLATARTTGPVWERARNVAMIVVLRGTGGRIGEVIGATMEGLNLEGGILTTTGKGGQKRALFLNEPEMGALHQWLELRAMIPTRSDHLFIGGIGRHAGRPLTRSAVYKILRKLCAAAGVPLETRHNPHSFRHGFAHKSLDNGARIDEVSQMMGHSSVAVTIDYYGQWDVQYLSMAHRRTSPTRQMQPAEFEVAAKQ